MLQLLSYANKLYPKMKFDMGQDAVLLRCENYI